MASDRTRERVEEFMGRAGLGDVSFGCADLCDCERCKRAWTALLDAFERETTEPLRKALRDVLTLLDEGKLVRDISHDHESDWAIKQLPMIRTLANAAELANLLQPAAQPTPEVKK